MDLNKLSSYTEEELKEYILQSNDSVTDEILLLATKLINILDPKILQNTAENHIEVREALHRTYQNIEDVLEINCTTRLGDLRNDTEIRANILVSAAKKAKKKGIKFEPSLYISNYKTYNKDIHGNPVEYLKKHFGEFLLSCNEKKDYLFSGDIALIDSLLWGTLYRNYSAEYQANISKAGKKSVSEVNGFSMRAEKKIKKIISLDSTSRQ
jgi:hypothetical protein